MILSMKIQLTHTLTFFLLLTPLLQAELQQTFPTRKTKSSSPKILHFRWPIPAKAFITERSLRRGRNAVTSYRFEITPDPKDKSRWVGRMTHIQVKEMETGKATKEQIILSKKILAAISSALPTLSIDPKTLDAKAIGVRKGVEAVLEVLQKNSKSPKDKQFINLISKSMKSEAMLRTLQESSLSFWKAWASVWNGLELPSPGSSQNFKGVMFYPMGGRGKCKVTLSNLGSPKAKPEWIRLRYHQVADSSVLKAVVNLMKKSAPVQYRDRIREDMFESAKISVNIQATLDRKTLLPQRIQVEKISEIKAKGRPISKRLERRDYSFVWQKS
jgi:hypothetical protein